MKFTLAVTFSLFCALLFSQTTIFIKDQYTNESIPFVKVRPDVGNPLLADIDGSFILNSDVTKVDLRMNGYRDTIVRISDIIANTIFLQPIVQNVQEVIAVAGENPAHRIMDIVIANRKKNNPLDNDAFRYESYSKFILGVNQEAIDSIPEETTDTLLIKIRDFFAEQYLFMLESASTRTFLPPSRDKEEITAYKVSGFSSPMFSTFANEMQSFSFYENQFELMGKTYINPIAFGGTRRYLFVLEDTLVNNQDTTFTIFYRPRRGKNFDGMTGRLYINTNGYAIEKVTASPYEDTTGTVIQIVQEYQLIENKKWFPSKLSTEISIKGATLVKQLKDGYVQGKGSTYIKSVQLNPTDIRKRDFDNVSVTTTEDAGTVKNNEWDSLRKYKITDKELRTYEMVDSLSKDEKFEEKMLMLSALFEGKLPLGNFNLDLTRLIDYHNYEGYRFGAGLETSKKLMKNASIGGYYGWATRDKESKFGGYSTIHLYKKRGVKLNLRYQQDLLERGGRSFQKDVFTLTSNSLYNHFFITNMERQRLGEVALSGNIRSNMKISLIGNYQRIWYTEGYRYFPSDKTDVDLAETSVEFTWNIREKVMQLGDHRISKGTKYPKITFKVTKGWKDWIESDYDYVRLHSEIQQEILIRAAGKLIWSLSGSQTIGDVPLFLMQVANGTGLNWHFSVINSFETMRPSEFYNTRQATLFTRFNFTPFKTKAKWNEPQICLHHAIGYGEMNSKTDHSVEFKSMDKGFFEGGLILNNVLVFGFSGIGIAAFYRYGEYADPDWKKNIVPKISVSFNL